MALTLIRLNIQAGSFLVGVWRSSERFSGQQVILLVLLTMRRDLLDVTGLDAQCAYAQSSVIL